MATDVRIKASAMNLTDQGQKKQDPRDQSTGPFQRGDGNNL